MDNNQKLAFIMQLERKRKIKRIAMGIVILLVFGGLMIFFQIKNFQNIG